jgi:CLIP-associating protein 1/2
LKNFKVRPAIEQAIVKELIPTSSAPTSQPDSLDDAPVPTRPNLAASVSSLSSERPVTPMLDNRPEQVDPMYVNTQRELDEIFREMHLFFEGRETEQNWLKREASVTKLRKLMAGNAATDFQDSFLAGLRALLDGIIKAITSLRTSLSKEGCNLVQEMAKMYGPGMDPMVELLMQTFIKLSAATKKITSQQANVTVDTMIGKVTYNARIMQHVWGACQDKNVQPRMYATEWLKTILKKESHHKSHVEHSGGLDMIDKCLKKGLADANPGVREKMRSTYWTFAGIWPARAEAILNSLDTTAQKLLQNDPNNPNSTRKPEAAAAAARPGLGLSKSTMGTSKPSLRETMLAQKKALASRNLPTRPGSAMSHFSPTRTVSNASTVSGASTATSTALRSRPESTLAPGGGGGLSVAPVRLGRRRPEMAARPATAGPYSVRSHDQASTEQASPPESIRSKTVTPRTIAGSPKRTFPRARPGHAATASESSLPTTTPSKAAGPKVAPSPRSSPSKSTVAKSSPAKPSPAKFSPAKPKQLPPSLPSSSPSVANESFTMVIPTVSSLQDPSPTPSASPAPVRLEQMDSDATPASLQVYEDPFTEEPTTPKPSFTRPVLEDKPVNEDAASLQTPREDEETVNGPVCSPEKAKQNSRLLDSGISKVKAKSLDVHGFRKLQSIVRENKAVITDERFEALLTGLFEFLESPLTQLAPERIQDVKAQILATIKLLLKKMRDNFQPHVSHGLESLLRARATYDGRTHIVSGLELLADDLVTLGDASEITVVLSRTLLVTVNGGHVDETDNIGSHRSLSMGLHVLKALIDARTTFMPSDTELATLSGLASRCLDSSESGVRMDAVQLCVALHARVGDATFWDAMKGIKDDPKSLITYYIVKRQREVEAATAVVTVA